MVGSGYTYNCSCVSAVHVDRPVIREVDQDHAAREPPRVQDPHAPKVWVDRRHAEDNKETARDRGHSSGQDDHSSQHDVVLRAARAIMEKEAQRKIDQEDALGQSEIDAAAAVLAAAEEELADEVAITGAARSSTPSLVAVRRSSAKVVACLFLYFASSPPP